MVLFQQLSCCSIGYYICFGGTDYPALIRLLWCGEIRLLLFQIVVVDLRGLPFCLFIYILPITLPLAFFSLLQLSSSPSIIPTTLTCLTCDRLSYITVLFPTSLFLLPIRPLIPLIFFEGRRRLPIIAQFWAGVWTHLLAGKSNSLLGPPSRRVPALKKTGG